jgi:hypothetical protein
VQFLIDLGANVQAPARFTSHCLRLLSNSPMYITSLHFACLVGKLVRVLMLSVMLCVILMPLCIRRWSSSWSKSKMWTSS